VASRLGRLSRLTGKLDDVAGMARRPGGQPRRSLGPHPGRGPGPHHRAHHRPHPPPHPHPNTNPHPRHRRWPGRYDPPRLPDHNSRPRRRLRRHVTRRHGRRLLDRHRWRHAQHHDDRCARRQGRHDRCADRPCTATSAIMRAGPNGWGKGIWWRRRWASCRRASRRGMRRRGSTAGGLGTRYQGGRMHHGGGLVVTGRPTGRRVMGHVDLAGRLMGTGRRAGPGRTGLGTSGTSGTGGRGRGRGSS
jgi:hypothetical protein